MKSSNSNMMSCQEVADLFYYLLDTDLPKAEEDRMLAHLKACSHCFEAFEIEKEFWAFVKQKAERKLPDPSLIEKIKASIEDHIAKEHFN